MKKNSLRLFIFSSLSVFSCINTVCIAIDPNQLATISYVDKRILEEAARCPTNIDQGEVNKLSKQLEELEQIVNKKVDETIFLTYTTESEQNVETQLVNKADKAEVDKLENNPATQTTIKKLEDKLEELKQVLEKKSDLTEFSTFKSESQKKLEDKLVLKVDRELLESQLAKKADISYVDAKWKMY